MAIDKQTLAAANKYTKKTVEGAGAIKGKNCTIQSIIPMPTIHETEVTFAWYEDGASLPTLSKMVVPDGAQGPQGEQGETGLGIKSLNIDSNRHLIVTYDDDTTQDAGLIPGGGGPGEIDTELDPTSTNAVENRAIAIPIAALQASMLTKADQTDISRIDLSISQLQGSLLNKVNKEAGKGLSTNDFSDTYKDKFEALLGIKSAGAGLNFNPATGELTATGTSIEIDTELDPTSVHPVQNKAIAIPIQALQGSMLTKANQSDITRIDLDITQLQGSLLTKAEQTDINRIDLSISQLQGSLLTKASKSEVPTKVSDLNNDSGFVTNTVNNLINYYLKSEVYTKADVDTLISAVSSLDIQVVAALPTTDISRTTIYLLPKSSSETSNVYDEYINLDGTTAGWEKIGDTQIDLSNYVTNDDLTSALADYTTTVDLTALLAAKQNTISDLATIRSGAAAGATAYQKPSTGIPKTDLTSDVQTSLGKADTALQAHQSLVNYYQTGDTAETDLQDGDYVPFYDSSASAKRKTLWSNIKAKLKSYFDSLYTSKSELPTKLSDLTNDEGFIDSSALPTKVSDLTNDSGYQTASNVATAISGKADKATTLSGYGITDAVSNSQIGSVNGVAELGSDGKVPAAQLPSYVDDVEEYATALSFPTTGESGKIYVALDTNKIYRWSGSTYVVVGGDLALGETSSTAYAGNKGKANADAISAIKDSASIDSFSDVENALSGKQATISDLSTIRSGAAAGATAYQKPSTGIPKTDLASAVQTSLGKADTALQSHQSLANYYQTGDTAETDLQDGDYVPFYDSSASAKRKTLWSNIKAKLKSYFDGIYSTVRSRQTPTSGGTTLSLVNTGDMYSWNNKATVNGHTMAPTPASGLTEATVVSTVKAAAANNDQVPSLYGVQKWTNEKKVRRTLSGASSIGSTGIGTWTDKDVSSITTSDETDWWYDAAFKIPDNANDVDIDFKFDPTGSLVTVGGYILDTTTGKLCVKFANTVDPATTKFAVDITYTRNEVS